MSSNNNDDDFAVGCLAAVLTGIFLMPLVGLYILIKGSEDKRALGWILTIAGCILWGMVFFGK